MSFIKDKELRKLCWSINNNLHQVNTTLVQLFRNSTQTHTNCFVSNSRWVKCLCSALIYHSNSPHYARKALQLVNLPTVWISRESDTCRCFYGVVIPSLVKRWESRESEGIHVYIFLYALWGLKFWDLKTLALPCKKVNIIRTRFGFYVICFLTIKYMLFFIWAALIMSYRGFIQITNLHEVNKVSEVKLLL